ncbi:hypothetical protein AAMO2058_001404300 [Amorphochlora amoebiformis]
MARRQLTSGESEDLKLRASYTFWCMSKDGGFKADAFAEGIKKIGSFGTANGFWSNYKYLTPPGDLKPKRGIDYHCFRSGIKPIWEDPSNENGGEWILRMKKGVATKSWENMLLAMLSGELGEGDEICGIVISIKPTEDRLTVWNKTGANKDIVAKIRDGIQRVLKVPNADAFEYLAHSSKIRQILQRNSAVTAGHGKHQHNSSVNYHSGRARKGSGKYNKSTHQRTHNHNHQHNHHNQHNKPSNGTGVHSAWGMARMVSDK